MTFKHPQLVNSPDFPKIVPELPPLDEHGYRQLCWGPSEQQVRDYVVANKLAEFPLNIAVGIMMIATGGKFNPQIAVNLLRESGCAEILKNS